jgi:hypothetical protein
MGEPSAKRQRRWQVNLELSEDEFRVLETLAFIQERPKSQVLLPLVKEYLNQQKDSPEVQEVLQGRKRQRPSG